MTDFNPGFASASEWARMYRSVGVQVVPANEPGYMGGSWKTPRLKTWRDLQDKLVPESTFNSWYGANGQHRGRDNMGLIAGRASGNLMVIDLDTQKTPAALQWWQGICAVHHNGMEPETWRQTTGGGGKQLFFSCPPGWTVPTNKTPIGVDIRGQGGFAMLPWSLHESGRHYTWDEGCEPWEIELAPAPDWLLAEVLKLVGPGHGGNGQDPQPGPKPPPPDEVFTPFGTQQDEREDLMFRMVWHAVLEMYRYSPIKPPEAEWQAHALKIYPQYEAKVTARHPGPKSEALDRDGRGPIAWIRKFEATMRRWGDEDFVREAKKPPPEPPKDDWQARAKDFEEPKVDPATGQPLPLILTAEQFVAGFTPPEYVIDGILQRGYIYGLTARTGHGKTAVAMYVAQCLARGEPMHSRAVKTGTVLFLAGENPDDIRARYLVLAEANGFDPTRVRMRFIAGVVSLPERMAEIEAVAAEIDDLVAVMVDTAAAYFPGDETNSNSQQAAYARLLRRLTFLRGKPLVLVNCHPIKNAARDNLLPMGGSAFLNEIDGNLTLWADSEKHVTLHWQGKFRGPEFEPVSFELVVAQSDRVKDAAGRLMPSIVARPVSDQTLEQAEQLQISDEDKLLRLIYDNPTVSQAGLALLAGWTAGGKAHKSKVARLIGRLLSDKLISRFRGGKYQLTAKGEKVIGVTKSKVSEDGFG